ncbi:hypothetical protein BJF85_09900 [Saccharomonospora sp. CUA-673]|uniref:lipid droplet-associated protein n=1 Tax=Saccharomonospora sp. CUA-673 TaxID=1904969 RepID=UPI000963482D|nr:lipid droplet-associated protein [Saccharomonospora sp. CUA-673]OLT49179.1 hypothetical protein BJF85_09900 [Saccharomonospora sp. CUA-673]
MKHFPFPVRVAAGIAASTADTVRDLPKHLTELPVTVASQVLQTSMRVQQHVTELAIKGDDALAAFRAAEDDPNWATFDEDDDLPEPGEPGAEATFDDPWDAESHALGEEHEDGEFDSAELPEQPDETATATTATTSTADTTSATSTAGPSGATGGSGSAPAGLANYDELTLPQLRSRLRSFSAEELEELLGYERDNENRPSFTGMLTRRIANVRAEANGGAGAGQQGSGNA